MPFKVKADIREARKSLRKAERRQIPFAASRALNSVAFDTRKHVVERLYPNAFPRARNKAFPRATFRVQKSNKRKLISAVYDRLGRGELETHVTGGSLTGNGSRRAIPVNVKRTSSGRIPKNKRARVLPRSFQKDFGRGEAVWQVQRGGRLKLMYTLKQAVSVRGTFPFFRSGYRFARTRWPRAFDRAIKEALRTAR